MPTLPLPGWARLCLCPQPRTGCLTPPTPAPSALPGAHPGQCLGWVGGSLFLHRVAQGPSAALPVAAGSGPARASWRGGGGEHVLSWSALSHAHVCRAPSGAPAGGVRGDCSSSRCDARRACPGPPPGAELTAGPRLLCDSEAGVPVSAPTAAEVLFQPMQSVPALTSCPRPPCRPHSLSLVCLEGLPSQTAGARRPGAEGNRPRVRPPSPLAPPPRRGCLVGG